MKQKPIMVSPSKSENICLAKYVMKTIKKHACMLNHVWLFVTPWSVAHQPPLSMRLLGRNTGVGCRFFLQGIFPTQELNPCLLCIHTEQADF